MKSNQEFLPIQRIQLGSTSTHKIEALKEACERMGVNVEIVPCPVESGINAQPYGMDETYQGAYNRAMHARNLNPDVLAIGIESGVIPVTDKFVDLAIVVVVAPKGEIYMSTSAGIEFPKEAVEVARKRGFITTTVGSVLTETFGGSGTDPHAALTNGKVSRKETLVQALVVALAQTLFSTQS